jgi:hypothetical protein
METNKEFNHKVFNIFIGIFIVSMFIKMSQFSFSGLFKIISFSIIVLLSLFLILFKKNYFNRKIFVIFISFTLWIVYQFIMGSSDILFSVFYLSSLLLLFSLSFFLIPKLIDSKEKILDYNKVFFWGILVSMILFLLLSIGNPNSLVVAERTRFYSFFSNPNTLGAFSLIGIITCIATYTLNNNKKYLIPSFFYLILMFSSNSRGSITTLIFALSISFLLIKLLKSNLKTKLLTIIISISVIWIIFLLINSHAFDTLIESNSFEDLDDVSSGRLAQWQTLNWKSPSIIFGTSDIKIVFTNYYLGVLATSGLIGLSLLITILLKIFSLMNKLAKNSNSIKLTWLNYLLFIALLSYGLFEGALFNLGNFLSIYLLTNIGIIISYQLRVEESQ